MVRGGERLQVAVSVRTTRCSGENLAREAVGKVEPPMMSPRPPVEGPAAAERPWSGIAARALRASARPPPPPHLPSGARVGAATVAPAPSTTPAPPCSPSRNISRSPTPARQYSTRTPGALSLEGVTFAWTTPILRLQLEADDEKISIVADAINSAWEQHKRDSNLTAFTPQTLSDSFFDLQRNGFHAGGRHLLAGLGWPRRLNRQSDWHKSWQQAIVQYVGAATGPEQAAELSKRKLGIFAWAGVHEGCSRHSSHFHEDAAVSGSFYLVVPEEDAGGAFVADDPRGPRPPFDNRIRHRPRPGELLPISAVGAAQRRASWSVWRWCGEQQQQHEARVAISFNLGLRPPSVKDSEAGNRAADAYSAQAEAPLWEVLSDASVTLPIET